MDPSLSICVFGGPPINNAKLISQILQYVDLLCSVVVLDFSFKERLEGNDAKFWFLVYLTPPRGYHSGVLHGLEPRWQAAGNSVQRWQNSCLQPAQVGCACAG